MCEFTTEGKIQKNPSSILHLLLYSLYCSPLFSFVVCMKFFGSRDGLSSCFLLRGTRELLNAVKVNCPMSFFFFFSGEFTLISPSLWTLGPCQTSLSNLYKNSSRVALAAVDLAFLQHLEKKVFFSCRFIKKFTDRIFALLKASSSELFSSLCGLDIW